MTTATVVGITDELIAEIEKAANGACQYSSGDWFALDNFATIFGREDADYLAIAKPFTIIALLARLRAAETDAARYRWIRDKNSMPGVMSSNPDAEKYFNEYMLCDDALDKVIDAARKEGVD